MSDTTAPAGWSSLVRGGNGLRALVITGGVAIHAVSIYVVATIMPMVVGDVGGLAYFSWTSTLYIAGSLFSASAVPLLLSRTQPRIVYRLAFGLFLTGSLVCALAPSMAVLLAGRLLQGLGGGMLPALAYAIVRVAFAPSLHARAIALVGSVWGVAALLGPLVGGIFAEMHFWRGAFGIDVVIGVSFVLLSDAALRRTESDEPGLSKPFPGVRLALLVLAAIAVSLGGATSRVWPSVLGIVAALVLIAAMLRLDGLARRRMLPGGAFNPRSRLGAVSATIGLLIFTSSPCTFIPYLLSAGHGISPLIGGYVNAIYAMAWTIVSLLTASAPRRWARAAIAFGPVLMLAGLLLQAWAVPSGSIPLVACGQILLGTGIGMGWAHLGALLMDVAPAGERDIAGPFISTTQTLAAVFGTAVVGMVANVAGLAHATSPAEIDRVGHWLFGVLSVAPLAASVLAWRTLVLTGDGRRGRMAAAAEV